MPDTIQGKTTAQSYFKKLAGNGGNTIAGNDCNNVLNGTECNDRIDTKGGRDRVYAGGGNDTVEGGSGDDTLYGGNGHDWLKGGAGNDQLYGGNGNDKLFVGELGNDTMTGGAGEDQFWIVDEQIPSAGTTITDFKAGEDVIALGAGLAFADLKINQLGDDTLISTKDGNKALAKLINIDASTISINNFVSTAPRPLIIGHRGASGLRPEHTLVQAGRNN